MLVEPFFTRAKSMYLSLPLEIGAGIAPILVAVLFGGLVVQRRKQPRIRGSIAVGRRVAGR
jgi:hypothetical protein